MNFFVQDGNFTQSYQQNRIMKNEVRILPGDELILECEYSTLRQDKFTFVSNLYSKLILTRDCYIHL